MEAARIATATFAARLWTAGVGALVIATLLFAYAPTTADEDLWGHLRFGQDLLRSGAIVRGDGYSYTAAEAPWINHEWLAEAVFAWIYDHAGAPGLIGFKVTIAMIASIAGFWWLTTSGLNPVSAGFWQIAAEFLMLPGFGSMRPQIFTCLFVLALIMILDRAERGHPRALWVLPPLFGLWTNLHGGVLAGAGIALLWVAGHAAVRMWRRALPPPHGATAAPDNAAPVLGVAVLLPLAAAIAATLLNPYGIRLWWFLRTALVPRPDIAEWTPLPLASLGGAVYLLIGALAVVAILTGPRPARPGMTTVFFALLLLPLLAVRHTPLFGIGALLIAGPCVADAVASRTGSALPLPVDFPAPRRLMLGVFLAAAAALCAASVPAFRCIAVDDPFPARAVARLERAGVTGHAVVHFDWGEYVLWHLGPRVKVSVDGRRETLYEPSVYAANMRFIDGVGEWDTLLRDPSVTMVLASKRFPSFNLMRLAAAWVLVDEDDTGGLFVRQGSDALNRLQAMGPVPLRGGASATASACFP